MRLGIILPDRLGHDAEVRRIVAEAPDGSFGMLPNHVDFVSQFAPGILVYDDIEGRDRYVWIHSGTLAKLGDDVLVFTSDAALGDDLDTVQRRARGLPRGRGRRARRLSRKQAEG